MTLTIEITLLELFSCFVACFSLYKKSKYPFFVLTENYRVCSSHFFPIGNSAYFFKDEQAAVTASYWPCGTGLPKKYALWKAKQKKDDV